jgi:hypothetical protein
LLCAKAEHHSKFLHDKLKQRLPRACGACNDVDIKVPGQHPEALFSGATFFNLQFSGFNPIIKPEKRSNIMDTTGWIVLGITNIPVYFLLGWVWFKDWEDFWESVRFWLTPDILSAIRGEFMDDWWAEMKLGFWMASCTGCVFAEALMLEKWAG